MLSDEDFAAVLYACRSDSSLGRAENIIHNLDVEETSVKPGPHCYNTLIVLCTEKNRYAEALGWYDKMNELGIELQAKSSASLILASYTSEGVEEAKRRVLSLIEDDSMTVGRHLGKMVLRLYLPQEHVTAQPVVDDLEEIRRQLRVSADKVNSQSTRDWFVDIIRCLRLADMEDKRQPSGFLAEKEIDERRSQAWKEVIKVCLSAQSENHEDGDAS